MSSTMANMTADEKNELMEQVEQNNAIVYTKELLAKMTKKCFKKCINKPGVSLDSSEKKCISMCMDRFMDSWKLVNQTYHNRLQREQSKM